MKTSLRTLVAAALIGGILLQSGCSCFVGFGVGALVDSRKPSGPAPPASWGSIDRGARVGIILTDMTDMDARMGIALFGDGASDSTVPFEPTSILIYDPRPSTILARLDEAPSSSYSDKMYRLDRARIARLDYPQSQWKWKGFAAGLCVDVISFAVTMIALSHEDYSLFGDGDW